MGTRSILLMFWAVAGLLAAISVALGWSIHQIDSWPRASAVVVSSRLVPSEAGSFQAEVVVVLGSQERHLSAGQSQTAQDLQNRLDACKPGAQLVVSENPANSADVRLPPEPGDWIIPLALMLGAALFAATPAAVMALARSKQAFAWTGRLFILLGAACLASAPVLAFERVQVLRNWPETEAKVLNVWDTALVQGNRRLSGEFAFRAGNQDVRTVISSRGFSQQHLEIGSTQMIRYNPQQPRQATFEASWSAGYFWEALVAAAVGLSTSLLGLAVARWLS
ncbi:MAG: DUF3592 domain-containing protein [Vulcanimicrobiota bacterium]